MHLKAKINRFIHFLIILCFIANNLNAQIEFEDNILIKEIDSSKKIVDFNFKFTNKSKKTIKIKKIVPSCGCIVTNEPHMSFNTQDSGEIKGVFYTDGLVGFQNREIIVHTDSLDQPRITLSLNINIKPILKTSSKVLYLRMGEFDIAKNIKIDLLYKEINIKKVSSDSQLFTVNCTKTSPLTYDLNVLAKSLGKAARSLLRIDAEYNGENYCYYVYLIIK